ncbi:hypothetical protein NBRC111893_2416 [Lentilactobacillus kosonis]|uniref:Uncharacterized protein n=2 Tax=Lentilactobacillus kosonis TaxID=2810561 RepID=A0A401FPG2_9LACO|nr:hypothetical protein NBRC111893_2416 [Lentilactobacillus kosonis]
MVKQDKKNSDTIDNFYHDALQIVANHIKAFYLQYADDTGLSLSQVTKQVNSWDKSQFEHAINELMGNMLPDNELDQRLAVAYVEAQGNRRALMGAIIGASMDIATTKTKKFALEELDRQYAEGYNVKQYNHMTKNQVPQDVKQHDDFQDRLWVHNDLAKSNMQKTLNQALRSELDKGQLKQLLKIIAQDGVREDRNLATDLNKALSGVHVLVKDESILNSNAGYEKANAENPMPGFDYGLFCTQEDDNVCKICAPLDRRVFFGVIAQCQY